MSLRDTAERRALSDVVFLIDCDNTLLDNDGVEDDFSEQLLRRLGGTARDSYWRDLRKRRDEVGYVDYLAGVQLLRESNLADAHLFELSEFLLEYPFANRLYPGALDVIRHLGTWGSTVILSDGDVVLQPRKIERSGIAAAVDGRVMISMHKQQILDLVTGRYPAAHYVMIDDKLRTLTAMKAQWSRRLTTVFPRQGHYALDPEIIAANPVPDITINGIGDLLAYDFSTLPALPVPSEVTR